MTQACTLCHYQRFTSLFSLGTLPLGFPQKGPLRTIWSKPLSFSYCPRCLLIQTKHKIPFRLLPKENLYPSDIAKTVQQHDLTMARTLPRVLQLKKQDAILEIGCGDGQLLNEFSKIGYSHLFGVDPALHPDKKYAFKVIPNFFNKSTIANLKYQKMHAKCIILNYVLELVPDVSGFFEDVDSYLKQGAFLVIEVPYFVSFIKSFRIDGFAHLRCNWFTISSLLYGFEHHNLEVISIQIDKDYRGGTLRIVGKKTLVPVSSKKFVSYHTKETKFLKTITHGAITKMLRSVKNDIHALLRTYQKQKMPVIAYGAGLKANTLINTLQLTHKDVAFAVDKDPNKQNRYIPKANIPVRPLSKLPDRKALPVCILLCALDHTKEVLNALTSSLPKGSVVIISLPKLTTLTIR